MAIRVIRTTGYERTNPMEGILILATAIIALANNLVWLIFVRTMKHAN